MAWSSSPTTFTWIPPNTSMVLKKGVLRLGARALTRGRYMPVDQFLRSLAEDRGNRAMFPAIDRALVMPGFQFAGRAVQRRR
jgi:hypothetical protein